MGRPTFKSLADALEFLDSSIENLAALSGACKSDSKVNENVLKALQHFQKEMTLSKRYEGREFPAGEKTFKLGGHGAELGHTHIDFAKKLLGGWLLEDIWICR